MAACHGQTDDVILSWKTNIRAKQTQDPALHVNLKAFVPARKVR